jgi:poly(A) polymerase
MQNGSAPAATLSSKATPSPVQALSDAGYQTYLGSYSALDRYFGTDESLSDIILTRGDLIALARLFDELTFPGFPLEHAATRAGGRSVFFRCADDSEPWPRNPFTVLDLRYEVRTGVFHDPHGVYGDLRRSELVPAPEVHPEWVCLTEAARLVSRYHYAADPAGLVLRREPPPVAPEYQRQILCDILSAPYPEKGMDLLLQAGLVELWWPEVSALAGVDHAKEHHPEGGGWQHTLATFAHRKRADLILSLALLLHDVGKASARPVGRKRFFAHADIGAQVARRFLRRLGFDEPVVEEVGFLVRYHMMPGAMREGGSSPGRRALLERIMAEPAFPRLLELFRADTLATFASPEPYYRACRIYRSYRGGGQDGEAPFGIPVGPDRARGKKNRPPHGRRPTGSKRHRVRRRPG